MERRVFTFMLASALFLTIYMGLNVLLPNPNRPAGQGADEQALAEQALEEEEFGDPAELAPPPITPGNAENNVSAVDETAPAVSRPTAQWTTLGSMAADSGHNMLVTLSSKGGAIERIELTERKPNGRLKYRRVDVRSGYLGYLALAAAEFGDGVIVRVVGPGTPAELALSFDGLPPGLKVGDKIVAAGNRAIAGPADLAAALEATDPGTVFPLEIIRQADAADAADAVAGQPLRFEATLTEHPLDLVRLADTAGDEQVLGNFTRASCLLTLAQVGKGQIRTGRREIADLTSQHRSNWQLDPRVTSEQPAIDGDAVGPTEAVGFRLALSDESVKRAGGSGGVEMIRTYRLTPGTYHLDMDIEVVNQSASPQKLAYRLEGPNGLTLEGWWYSTKISPNWSGAGARDFVYNTVAENHELISTYNILKHVLDKPQDPYTVVFTPDGAEERRQLRYISVDTQYFSTAFVPLDGEPYISDFSRAAGTLVAAAAKVPKHQERAANVSFFVDSNPQNVAPGESLKNTVRLFAGPKQPEWLERYQLSETLEYGWFPWVAKPLSALLHFFYAVAGNYAIAIIMLTLLVRGCMFPLSRKAAIHAQKMQELAPELKKIADKYKDDFEKRLKAQRELQQRVGFNPLSGCLPMFFQLPIFIGLYRALSVDIELRQAALAPSLQWCSNLAGPDMLYYWGDWLWEYLSGRGTGWLGPYFNILPIIVVVLFLLQQKMFMPPATDEQTAMTQKVMTIMTMMMGLFFFRVPSGLCIYFITSSLWGIAERKLVKKMIPTGPALSLEGTDGGTIDGRVIKSKADTGNGAPKTSIANRLLTAAGRPPERVKPVLPPKKRKRPPGKK